MDLKKNFQEAGGIKSNPLPNAISQNEHSNWTALHEAAATGDENKCQALLSRNFDRTAKSTDGNTPLHEAAWRGYSRCVKIFCTCPVNSSDAKDKKPKAVKTAKLASTFLDIQNNGGFTALHLAAQNGHNQSCRELLLAGADPDIKNNYGDTPLHTSCRYGHAGATRILISADCDPNKVNLNGDHALHITCAMGRRKLTRLLLEADCDMTMQNAQGETPRDIAKRKNFSEILEILKNPQRIRNRREKSKQQSRKSSLPDPADLNSITWSPYGCHYFPDPRSFPSPKLETLPKEPLKKGEQYYLDLAGRIRKGPIGIGNTCYCGPFFKHIEHKINSNQKSLRKYVHKTKECLDNKVQELALKTIDNSEQIEQLTRSIIADRVRCESRRLHLSSLLKRGEPLRATIEHQLRSGRKANKEGTLERSRSMEILDESSIHNNAMSNAKSFGGLLNEASVIVHQRDNICSETEEEDALEEQEVNSISADSIYQPKENEKLSKNEIDLYHTTERLSELLQQSNLLNETENSLQSKSRPRELPLSNGAYTEFLSDNKRNPICSTLFDFQKGTTEDYDEEGISYRHKNRYVNIENVNDCKGFTQANSTGHRVDWKEDFARKIESIDLPDCTASNPGNIFREINVGECTFQNVISALQKDQSEIIVEHNATKIRNEIEPIAEDKLSYKRDIVSCDLNSSLLHSKATAKRQQALYIPDEGDLPGLTEIEIERDSSPISVDQRVNGKIEKVEVKNSEIKMLKKSVDTEPISKRNRVQELVARLQGKLSTSHILPHYKKRRAAERRTSHSESSEDEQNNHNEYKNSVQSLNSQKLRNNNNAFLDGPLDSSTDIKGNDKYSVYTANNFQSMDNLSPQCTIPKDAYFHELPNKKRDRISASTTTNILPTLRTETYRDYSQKDLHLELPIIHSQFYEPSSNFAHQSIPQASQRNQIANGNVSHLVMSNVPVTSKSANIYSTYDLTLASCQEENFSPVISLSTNISRQNYVPYIERDVSNDSGVSTRFYGVPFGPSPSLSPQTYFPSSDKLHLPENGETNYHQQSNYDERNQNETTMSTNVDYALGNISSLV